MTEKIAISFPDGNSKKVEKGINGFEIAKKISKSLSKEAIAFSVNGELMDLSRKIEQDSEIKILNIV